jgi:hypothetical protein
MRRRYLRFINIFFVQIIACDKIIPVPLSPYSIIYYYKWVNYTYINSKQEQYF